jgi:polyhydroxyalkanoate synthase subunit PhaC
VGCPAVTTNETEPASEEFLANSRAGAGFEAVLANAAVGGFGGLFPSAELGRLAQAMVRRPKPVARRVVDLAARLGQVGIGVPDQPGARDRRFADRAWAANPALQRLALGYLASCDAATGILEDADVDWRTRERLRLTFDNVTAALAPTNDLLTNPESWKEVIDTGGHSLRAGLGNLLGDLHSPAKLPTSVDRSAFELGRNLAATAGQVVRKTRIYELIQYQPRADKVDAVPLVVISSPVNKFYLLDLEPEPSVARAELDAGRQVFVASWVNPDASHADVGFDEYVIGIVEMLDTVAAITGSDASHLLGLCGGGVLAFLAAAYLAAIGREGMLASLTVAIAVLDYHRGPSAMAFLDRKGAEKAMRRATEHGFFDARDTARAFALIRPIEGIWNIAVHNYLLGQQPPAMGLLYWAADQTNMATKFGGQMMQAALENSLIRPGGVIVGGVPIDPARITVDTYVLGASTDHISPWRDCYRTVAMVGGDATFVLARGGHAIVIAKGPGSPRASYRTGGIPGSDPDEWLASSVNNTGSWWEHWNDWISKRTPDQKPAPARLGNDAYPPLGDAPGEYVKRLVT